MREKSSRSITVSMRSRRQKAMKFQTSVAMWASESSRMVKMFSGWPSYARVVDTGGVMKKVNATHGLLVCWGGFKSSIDRDETQQFFHVRLWDADDLIDELLGVYDKLDADLRALVPLKRVWTLTAPDES